MKIYNYTTTEIVLADDLWPRFLSSWFILILSRSFRKSWL